jgi:hypothetical protein
MKMLDFLAHAANMELRGEGGINWVWYMQMTAKDHARFDLWLVKTEDPLAPLSRFTCKVTRMVELERERRERRERS